MNELRKIMTIARYSFVEIYKSRVIFNIFFIGLGILILSYLATEFTFGVPQKVAIDIGLGALSLSAVFIAIFMGAGLIAKEIENRTVYMVLVRPLKRSSFLVGKILGMLGILALNILILGILSVVVFVLLGGDFSPLIAWSIFLSFLEAAIVLLVVVFFSLITNTVMSIIYTLAIYIAGHAISGIQNSQFVLKNNYFKFVVDAYHYIFPNFSKLNLKDFVVYQQNIDSLTLLHSASYGLIYLITLLVICALIFERKNLD